MGGGTCVSNITRVQRLVYKNDTHSYAIRQQEIRATALFNSSEYNDIAVAIREFSKQDIDYSSYTVTNLKQTTVCITQV